MPKKSVSFKDKLRYRFENTLSAGPIAIIGWLAVVSVLIVLLATAIITLVKIGPEENHNFFEAFWQTLMRAMDAGTVAGDTGWKFRALMFTVTLGGIFIISTLIGTITSGMESSIEELRKGRSRVIESNHTLILGWSPKIFPILSELIKANMNQKKPRIVIMADMDKVEMEDEIRSKIPNTRNTRVICRTGSPLDLDDLEVVNPHEAKSIIILSPDTKNPDTHVIKSILALTNNPNRLKKPYHIVAEVQDDDNMEAAELVSHSAYGLEARLIQSSDLIARVTAQTCRQSGLSVVYTELCDFDGSEIYFKEEAVLTGQTYHHALSSFQTSAVIGVMTENENVMLNPPMNYVLKKGDQLIVIAEDDDTIKLDMQVDVFDKDAIRHEQSPAPGSERTLIIGWNEKGSNIIRELESYVGSNSEVTILCQSDHAGNEVEKLNTFIKKQQIKLIEGDTTNRAMLESLKAETYNHIIILCYNEFEVQEADAKTLITLLHLRNISEKAGKDFSIVSEMRDIRNQTLANVARADDFIVSDNLISLMLSQISENKHLDKVFKDLFSPEGSEIYLKPIKDYVLTNRPVNFYTLLEAAADRGETAIGYRIQEHATDASKAYGVVVNPDKNIKLQFTENDRIIVLAED